jgi:hypothetical protein
MHRGADATRPWNTLYISFFSVVLGAWTFFDWSLLSVDDVLPDDTVAQSMPKDGYIVLGHIRPLGDFFFMFLLTWPEFIHID